MTNYFRTSFDGKQLFTYQWRAENPKANILLLHGMKEHSGRYRYFAEKMNQMNYSVFAIDHRGHGHTDEKSLGKTKEKDVFQSIIMDNILFGEELKQTGLPLVVFGHSFGSFLSQRLLSVMKADAFIMTGSNYMHTVDVFFGIIFAYLGKLFKGGEADAILIEKLCFGRLKQQSEKLNSMQKNSKAEKSDAETSLGNESCCLYEQMGNENISLHQQMYNESFCRYEQTEKASIFPHEQMKDDSFCPHKQTDSESFCPHEQIKNKQSNTQENQFEWLGLERKTKENYKHDPLCGFPLCNNYFLPFFKHMFNVYEKIWEKPTKTPQF
jgi:esterase/lipase